MMLIVHILIAISSIIVSGLAAFLPSVQRLRWAAVLTAGTLASGTYLVFHFHAPLTSSCITGLVYLMVVATGIAVGAYRLATAKQRVR